MNRIAPCGGGLARSAASKACIAFSHRWLPDAPAADCLDSFRTASGDRSPAMERHAVRTAMVSVAGTMKRGFRMCGSPR